MLALSIVVGRFIRSASMLSLSLSPSSVSIPLPLTLLPQLKYESDGLLTNEHEKLRPGTSPLHCRQGTTVFNTEQTLLRLEALFYGAVFLHPSNSRPCVCWLFLNRTAAVPTARFVPQCIIYHGYTPTLQIKLLLGGAGIVASGEY